MSTMKKSWLHRSLILALLFVFANGCDRWSDYNSQNAPQSLRWGTIQGLDVWSSEAQFFQGLLSQRQVQVETVVFSGYRELFHALRQGKIDAASVRTSSSIHEQQLVLSTVAYDDQTLDVICNPKVQAKKSRVTYVNRTAVSEADLKKMVFHHPELQNLVHFPASPSGYLKKLQKNVGTCAIVDSKSLNSLMPLFSNLNLVLRYPKIAAVSVAVRPDRPELVQYLNDVVVHSLRNGMFDSTRFLTFNRPSAFNSVDDRVLAKNLLSVLPKYEREFKKSSRFYDLPWQLVAAIGYQESKWNPDARSFTGVRGLMQLTEDTADLMNVEDRLDAKQSIWGGARYFAYLLRQIPDRLTEKERIASALAAYNMGPANVVLAKSICSEKRLNPEVWRNLKKCLLKVPDARGHETVQFVERSMYFWSVLRHRS